MDQIPVFTVIVPTYNRKLLLKRAIDSILRQTFKNFELIIIDDGSTDGTGEFVKTYDDGRIIYIYKENGGLNSARSKGIGIARGEYIAFCDSDDSWLPEKLEKHLQKYRDDHEVKVVYDLTGVEIIENGMHKVVSARDDRCEGWCYKEVLEQGYLTSPTFLSCKKECIERIGGLSMELTNCEDDDLCFRLCKYFKVGLIKEVLGIYYTDATNRISMMKKLCADDYLKFLEKWKDEVVRVCGTDVLRRKYYKAASYYMDIKDINTAREIYRMACETGNVSIQEIKNSIRKKLFIEDEVVIYGIGDWGEKIYGALQIIGCDRFIFAVTDKQKSVMDWHGRQVEEIGMLNLYIDKPLVIASSQYYDDMKTEATEIGFVHIFSYQEVVEMIFY